MPRTRKRTVREVEDNLNGMDSRIESLQKMIAKD